MSDDLKHEVAHQVEDPARDLPREYHVQPRADIRTESQCPTTRSEASQWLQVVLYNVAVLALPLCGLAPDSRVGLPIQVYTGNLEFRPCEGCNTRDKGVVAIADRTSRTAPVKKQDPVKTFLRAMHAG
eukprot:2506126-Rhodomonas_salina.1